MPTFVPCYDCGSRRPRNVMKEVTLRLEEGETAAVGICPRCHLRRQQRLTDFGFERASKERGRL